LIFIEANGETDLKPGHFWPFNIFKLGERQQKVQNKYRGLLLYTFKNGNFLLLSGGDHSFRKQTIWGHCSK
tara:strand:- start:280 stop:492 length:213 start_codon:yes stop_codon:yes gene_type:complete